MAQKRMFNKTLTNSDEFLDLPDSSQVLYFHLSMNADDEGFVNNWKSIIRMTGTKEDDLKLLIAKSFIIPFESGVIIIRHWRLNNYLQNDRIKPTQYQNELKQLRIDDNNVYNLYTKCIRSIDKNSIDKSSIDKNKYNVGNDIDVYKEIIDYLNMRIGSNYKDSTKKTRDLIKARLNEKFTIDDFKIVIDKMCVEWMNSEMQKYLRPETLFGTKFESYLNREVKQTTRTMSLTTDDIKDLFN